MIGPMFVTTISFGLIKFFSETKNEELLDLTYDEYDSFIDIFHNCITCNNNYMVFS